MLTTAPCCQCPLADCRGLGFRQTTQRKEAMLLEGSVKPAESYETASAVKLFETSSEGPLTGLTGPDAPLTQGLNPQISRLSKHQAPNNSAPYIIWMTKVPLASRRVSSIFVCSTGSTPINKSTFRHIHGEFSQPTWRVF